MEKPINIYKNLLWDILDDESKLTLIDILIKNGFEGDCKITTKVVSNSSVLEVRDESNHYLLLPVDIIDMLNK